ALPLQTLRNYVRSIPTAGRPSASTVAPAHIRQRTTRAVRTPVARSSLNAHHHISTQRYLDRALASECSRIHRNACETQAPIHKALAPFPRADFPAPE